jgi:putative restriction endonuclease
MPFFYLRTQGFWKSFTLEMAPAHSPEACFVSEIDEEFFDLLADAVFRLKARLLLVSRYFEPRERTALLESFGLCADGMQQPERKISVLNEEAEEAARKKGRSARFAVQVVSRYRFVCALTGFCCLTTDGAAIVDAAHIEPFAQSQNDDVENGLSLCKNAHWMFDEGLWSVLGDGRVVLSPHRFTESGPEALRLQPYAGRLLQFAAGVTLRPNGEYFARHRAFHGIRR